MSRIGKTTLAIAALALAVVTIARADAPTPDRVTLRDGSSVPCRVVELDARRLVIERADGRQDTIARADVVRIELGQVAVKPIVARVHVAESDDEVHVFIDGREVASPAALRGGWVDLVPLLHEGPNEITAEVVNRQGGWAYRWVLEAGAQKETFACGLAAKSGCREGGASGQERGRMPAGRAFLYVHRDAGEVVIQR